MRHRDYVAAREARDPAFREASEELQPQYEFRRAVIGARIAAGLTQQQLAQRMGTTQSVVARLESATRLPNLGTLRRWAAALDVDVIITPDQGLVVRPHQAA